MKLPACICLVSWLVAYWARCSRSSLAIGLHEAGAPFTSGFASFPFRRKLAITSKAPLLISSMADYFGESR